jgi:ABC-type multidrug transport system fused ATPase/permease subunit
MEEGFGFIFIVPFWAEAIMVILFLTGMLAAGYQIARRANPNRLKTSGIVTLQAAVLGLLALVLSFTYSYVTNRLQDRKTAVIEEANAIGTAYLRADVAPEPLGERLRSLLEAYAKTRVVTAESASSREKLRRFIAESMAVQQQLWPVVKDTLAQSQAGPKEALLVQAVNEVIDLHTVRLRAAFDRLPRIVMLMMLLIAGLGLLITGYAAEGINGWPNTAFALVLAFVIIVIVDMDRSQSGFVRVSQQPLMDLIAGIREQDAMPSAAK